jgi:hypothetical protein
VLPVLRFLSKYIYHLLQLILALLNLFSPLDSLQGMMHSGVECMGTLQKTQYKAGGTRVGKMF